MSASPSLPFECIAAAVQRMSVEGSLGHQYVRGRFRQGQSPAGCSAYRFFDAEAVGAAMRRGGGTQDASIAACILSQRWCSAFYTHAGVLEVVARPNDWDGLAESLARIEALAGGPPGHPRTRSGVAFTIEQPRAERDAGAIGDVVGTFFARYEMLRCVAQLRVIGYASVPMSHLFSEADGVAVTHLVCGYEDENVFDHGHHIFHAAWPRSDPPPDEPGWDLPVGAVGPRPEPTCAICTMAYENPWTRTTRRGITQLRETQKISYKETPHLCVYLRNCDLYTHNNYHGGGGGSGGAKTSLSRLVAIISRLLAALDASAAAAADLSTAALARLDSVRAQLLRDQPRISLLASEHDEISFELANVDVRTANRLRRAIMQDVPTLAIETVEMECNDGVIPDEQIAHRLGLLPLVSAAAAEMPAVGACARCAMRAAAGESSGCPDCQVRFVLDVTAPRFGDVTVTSNDLRIVSGHDPLHFGVVRYADLPDGGPIIITRLVRGQRLRLAALAQYVSLR